MATLLEQFNQLKENIIRTIQSIKRKRSARSGSCR